MRSSGKQAKLAPIKKNYTQTIVQKKTKTKDLERSTSNSNNDFLQSPEAPKTHASRQDARAAGQTAYINSQGQIYTKQKGLVAAAAANSGQALLNKNV